MISNDNWNQSSVKQYSEGHDINMNSQLKQSPQSIYEVECGPVRLCSIYPPGEWWIVDGGLQYLRSAVCAGASLVAAGWAGPRPDCAITTTNNTPPPPLYSSWDITLDKCCKRLIGEVVQSRRRPLLGPLLGPSPGCRFHI